MAEILKKMAHSDQDIRNRLLVARLPAMPQILLKLIELCQSDDSGMADIAKLIAHDAGMTTKVLRVANSAAYARSGRKVGLVQALSTLGLDTIKTLVISESVFQTFNGFPHTDSTDLRAFWKHSLTSAVLARDLAKHMDYPQVEEAYLAGLLHDVGRLALLATAPDLYSANFQAQDDETLCAVEQETLHITHAEAGAWLIERWDMDSFLADSVLYHHELNARLENAHPLIRIVHLANVLGNHEPGAALASEVGALCQVEDEKLLAIYQGAAGQVTKAAEYLGIDLSGMDERVNPKPKAASPSARHPVRQQLNDEVRNRTLTTEAGQLFARQKTDAGLLEAVRQNARILFDLDDTLVFLMNETGQTLVGVAADQHRQRLAEFSVVLANGGGIANAALQRNVAFLRKGQAVLSLQEEQLLRVFDADGLLCVPMVSGAQCLGMMVCGLTLGRMAELKTQEKFLLSFGARAAAVLETLAKERGEANRRTTAVREEFSQNSRKVVHEANNPLSIIKNYLAVLDDKLSRQEPVAGELSILNEEIDRVGSIIKEFAGIAPVAAEASTDINRVVDKIVRLFRESEFLPDTVQVVAQLAPQACEISGSEDALKQIFINLIKNAVEALPLGGDIEIINNGTVRRDGRNLVELLVRDTGPGIPAEVLPKLFSPVQSTKAGENRGLGLSIVHGLVKQLHGFISCRSSQFGTTFEILLPIRPVVPQVARSAGIKDEI